MASEIGNEPLSFWTDSPYKKITTQNPKVQRANHSSSVVSIETIERYSHQTIVHFKYTNLYDYDGWVNIMPSTCIQTISKQYKLTEAVGIPYSPQKHVFQYKGETLRFSLIFPAIEENISIMNIIEDSSSQSAFNFYGIDISSNAVYDYTNPEEAHPNFDKGVEYIEQTDYNNAIIFFKRSLQQEKYDIGLVYAYLAYAYSQLDNEGESVYHFLDLAVNYFTPVSKYKDTHTNMLLWVLPAKAYIDGTYGLNSGDVEKGKKYLLSAIQLYIILINDFRDYLSADDFHEFNARCGILKEAIGQADYMKYLQNGGEQGQKYLDDRAAAAADSIAAAAAAAACEAASYQEPSPAISRQQSRSKQLIKDNNFKLE